MIILPRSELKALRIYKYRHKYLNLYKEFFTKKNIYLHVKYLVLRILIIIYL